MPNLNPFNETNQREVSQRFDTPIDAMLGRRLLFKSQLVMKRFIMCSLSPKGAVN